MGGFSSHRHVILYQIVRKVSGANLFPQVHRAVFLPTGKWCDPTISGDFTMSKALKLRLLAMLNLRFEWHRFAKCQCFGNAGAIFFVNVWSCLEWVDDFYAELLKQQLQHRSQLSIFNILAPDFLSIILSFYDGGASRFVSPRLGSRLGSGGIFFPIFPLWSIGVVLNQK